MSSHARDSKETVVKSDVLNDKTGYMDMASILSRVARGEDAAAVVYGDKDAVKNPLDDIVGTPERYTSITDTWDKDEEEVPAESQSKMKKDIRNELADVDAKIAEMKSASELDLSKGLSDSISNSASTGTTGEVGTEDVKSEELFVRGANGRREKVTIDYADKSAIKEAYLKAAGMRKFQAERDELKKKYEGMEKEHTQVKSDFDKLSQAYDKDGIKGVVQLLTGGNGKKFDEFVNKELEHRDYMANLSADEKYKLEIQKWRTMAEQKNTETELQYKKLLEEQTREREEASLRSMESRINPTFDRYRFAGKLGDAAAEHRLDKALWSQAMEAISAYPDTVELTQALIDREFRNASADFRKMMKSQGEAAVRTTVENKKADANARVQVVAKKGMGNMSADKKKFVDDMKGGNMRDAFSAFFNGKVKL